MPCDAQFWWGFLCGAGTIIAMILIAAKKEGH